MPAGENVMERKFIRLLKQWEEQKSPEPLMVTGARQVGKTCLLKQFCEENYEDYVYVNLEEQRDCLSAFEGNLNPEAIIRTLEQLLGRAIGKGTAIFFDEIQQSEKAITSLKYFCESPHNYRVLCAGSLLGVKLVRFESSFPVGKVRVKRMYPMDFEEFLLACGEEALRDGIAMAAKSMKPLPDGVHQKALRLYHDYLFTGGMPRMVQEYLARDKNVMHMDRENFQNLQLAYLADMSKYTTSPAEGVKIVEVYNSVPRQLARDNPKFKYSEVRPRATRRDFQAPVDWLTASGMVYRVNKLEAPLIPLKGYEDAESFKIYLSDTGLLINMCALPYQTLLSETHNIYKGSVIENYVVQQLTAKGKALYYFKPSESMEIDLVWEEEGQIVPAEIKSVRHKRSTSLKNFREKYHPLKAFRFSELNFGESDGLLSVPLYACFCI